jgi:membrane protease YdiL (CAAX protease family)
MAAWTAFGAVVAVVVATLLALSYLTQQGMDASGQFDPGQSPTDREPSVARDRDDAAATARDAAPERVDGGVPPRDAAPEPTERGVSPNHDGSIARGDATADPVADSPAAETLTTDRQLSGGVLLANVAASQGTFTVVLVVAALATGVPAEAVGLSTPGLAPAVLLSGAALGVALAAANQGTAAVFRRFDVGFSEDLRELLAPESPGGWAALLVGVLPLVAVFEELLFRGILIGAFATGFGVDPWVLVVASSLLFAAGHGAQGAAGIVVTGALGLVLGAAFVLTDSLAAVVVAHYLVNALEFVVHER